MGQGKGSSMTDKIGAAFPGDLRDWLAVNATEKDIERHMGYEPKPSTGFMGVVMVPTFTVEQARYRCADAMLATRAGTGVGE
jgi:hypothetical protein